MTEQDKQINTFAQLAKDNQDNGTTPSSAVASGTKEMAITEFSDVAVGEQVSYTRPDLDGKDDIVEMFQVFQPDMNEPASLSKDKTASFWRVQALLTYSSKNIDGLNNREYISGARCFQQRDGSRSQVHFWYETTGKKSQCSVLWETVAKALNISTKDLSPRQFIAFLNSKPRVRIRSVEYDNYNAPKGAPATVRKNMPAEFVK